MPAPQPTNRVSTPMPARIVKSSKIALAVVAIQHVGVVGEMRLEDVEVAVEIVVADGDAHAGLLHPVLAQRDAALERFFAERAVVLVAKEPARRRIAGDVDVGPAVVVVVRGHGGHRVRARGGRDARLPADVGERAVAVVVKELHRSGRQPARPAVHRHALPAAVRVLAGFRQLLERRVQVRRDEEIETAVAIVVDPRAARSVAHIVLLQARLRGHVGERAIAVVVIQHVLAVVGDEEIVEAVVVVVADGHRRRPARSRQARLRRHIGKGAVAVVLVETIGRTRRRLRGACRSARTDRASRRCRNRSRPRRSPRPR